MEILLLVQAADINKIRAYMSNSANSNDIEYNPYTSNSAADAFSMMPMNEYWPDMR